MFYVGQSFFDIKAYALKFALSHYAGSICPNSENVTLTGTNLVCPNEVGFFRCTAQNGFTLRWNVCDETAAFISTDPVGRELTLSSNTTAYLVERIVLDESLPQGTRTSILSHEIDPNFMGTFVIMCDGGIGNTCNQTVYAIGGESLIGIIIHEIAISLCRVDTKTTID